MKIEVTYWLPHSLSDSLYAFVFACVRETESMCEKSKQKENQAKLQNWKMHHHSSQDFLHTF